MFQKNYTFGVCIIALISITLAQVGDYKTCINTCVGNCNTGNYPRDNIVPNRPGKRGPPGPIGPKGSTGECSCSVNSEVDQLKKKLETVTAFACQLGMKSGAIPDSAITSSSKWRNRDDHGPQNARLDKYIDSNGNAGWSADHSNPDVWIQVDLSRPTDVYGVIIQGRGQAATNQYITKFSVRYTGADGQWREIMDGGSPKIFPGNKEPLVWNIVRFHEPVTAKLFRIVVKTWNSHASMRFELLGC